MAASLTYDRHVIVVGKTGCGKSTVANHMMLKEVFDVKTDVDSVTTRTKHCSANLNYKGSNYKLTLIDTVGLFDTHQRGNKSIIEDVKSSITTCAPDGLNLVLFVIKQSRFTAEEAETFQFIIDNLRGKIQGLSAMIITCCENKNKKSRDEIIKKFRESQTTAKYADFMTKGIYTVGFPNESEMDEEDIPRMKEKMKKDEEQLHELIAGATTKCLKEEIRNETWWDKIKKFCSIM